MVAAWNDEEEVEATLRAVLADELAIPQEDLARFDDATPLSLDQGDAPRLLSAIGDRLGVPIDPADLPPGTLATYGRLLTFLRAQALR